MPKFVPITDTERPKSEQSFYSDEFMQHRLFENPDAVIRSTEESLLNEKDEVAQHIRHAEGENKMVKNEKGLWVRAKTVDVDSKAHSGKGMGRGNRGISILDKYAEDQRRESEAHQIPSSSQFEDVDERSNKKERRSPSTEKRSERDRRSRDDSRESRRIAQLNRSRSHSPRQKRDRSRDRDRSPKHKKKDRRDSRSQSRSRERRHKDRKQSSHKYDSDRESDSDLGLIRLYQFFEYHLSFPDESIITRSSSAPKAQPSSAPFTLQNVETKQQVRNMMADNSPGFSEAQLSDIKVLALHSSDGISTETSCDTFEPSHHDSTFIRILNEEQFLVGKKGGSLKINQTEIVEYIKHRVGDVRDGIHSIYASDYIQNGKRALICFKANEMTEILDIRDNLPFGLLPAHISLQEMIDVWVPLQFAEVLTFNLEDAQFDSSQDRKCLPFTFISHKYSKIEPGKIGKDARASLATLGETILWMDIFSMCQNTGQFFPGYIYDNHAKPIVDSLDEIVRLAETSCILLNPSESMDTDPLLVRFEFEKIFGFMKNVHRDLLKYIESYQLMDDSVLNYFKRIPGQLDLLMEHWLPTNEYFGRLWCHVEMLGMHLDSVLVYPGKMKLAQKLNYFTTRIYSLVWTLRDTYSQVHSIKKFLDPDYWNLTDLNYLCNLPRSMMKLKYILRGFISNVDPSPFSQVLTLSCFSDSDRIIVAEIEARLLKRSINIDFWQLGLKICLNQKLPSGDSSLPFSEVVKWVLCYPNPRLVWIEPHRNDDKYLPTETIRLIIHTHQVEHAYTLHKSNVWEVTRNRGYRKALECCSAPNCACHNGRQKDLDHLKSQLKSNPTFNYLCYFPYYSN